MNGATHTLTIIRGTPVVLGTPVTPPRPRRVAEETTADLVGYPRVELLLACLPTQDLPVHPGTSGLELAR